VDENLKEGEFFPASPLSDMTIKLSKLGDEAIADEWICRERRERSNSVFTCNIYAYIKAGCPTNVEFYEKNTETGVQELVISKEFTLSNPTVISIDNFYIFRTVLQNKILYKEIIFFFCIYLVFI
jgi:hypothetical protein